MKKWFDDFQTIIFFKMRINKFRFNMKTCKIIDSIVFIVVWNLLNQIEFRFFKKNINWFVMIKSFENQFMNFNKCAYFT